MRDSPSAESALSGGNPNHLNFCESALLIAEFVNARAKTTIGDITKELDLDRRSASQYLRRLWVAGLIGKRARGLFVPATSSPAFPEHTDDIDDSEQTEDFVGIVGADGVEDTERVEDSRESDDNDESDESGDTLHSGDAAQPEDTDDARLVGHEVPSAGGFGVIDDSDDRSLTDDSGAFDGSEQSEDFDDTAAFEDSEDCSASAELTLGSHFTAVCEADPGCHVPEAIVRSGRAVSRPRAASSVAVRQPPLCLRCNQEHVGDCL
ncbi:MAG: hypothetical protein QG597_758 [Actinomycetota bacterium]|nr:hypothetical protein [Actinomycetota bacterium]